MEELRATREHAAQVPSDLAATTRVLFWIVVGFFAAGAIVMGLLVLGLATGVGNDWSHQDWQIAIWLTVVTVPAVVIDGLVWSLSAPKPVTAWWPPRGRPPAKTLY